MAATGDGTVGKALDVLDQIAAFGRPVRFSELLDASPYPKATLYRLVQTLTHQGMLAFDPDRQSYAPGVRLVRLAHAAWAQSTLAPVARPYLDRLSASVGETVHLAQLDHAQVLYVDKRNATRPIEMFSQAGKIGPAYCTGVGKVMLAFLDDPAQEAALAQQSFHPFTAHTLRDAASLRAELVQIRAAGYGFDREEHEPGIICVALPILTTGDRLLGALSVTSTLRRTSLSGLELLVPLLRDTARQIARDAQDWRFPDTGIPDTSGAATAAPLKEKFA
ncbi:MAG: IclR family transcriptional regulator [Rhodobacterales bacterium]|nr:IclR family transcriptional regulator [Rhodobacterales bacterium]NCT11943.1 IclR family transcriptional regulator [Rhodobacterales bacterium]